MALTPLPPASLYCGLTKGEGLLQSGLRCHEPPSTSCPFVLRHLFIISHAGDAEPCLLPCWNSDVRGDGIQYLPSERPHRQGEKGPMHALCQPAARCLSESGTHGSHAGLPGFLPWPARSPCCGEGGVCLPALLACPCLLFSPPHCLSPNPAPFILP